MAIDDVEDINSRRQYTASAAQTAFDYPFPIFENSDIVVYDNSTLQVLTTDYTVSGAGNDSGGTITFLSGRTLGHTITIYRDIPIERISQFANDGPQSADAYNEELNRIVMVQQQLEELIQRCIRVPLISSGADSAFQLDMSAFEGKFITIVNGIPAPAAATVVSGSTGIPGLSVIAGTLTWEPGSTVEWSVTDAGVGFFNGGLTAAGLAVTGSAIPDAGIYSPSLHALALASNGVARLSISSIGLHNIPAPSSSGVALTVNGNTVAAVALVKTVTGNLMTATDGTRLASLLTVAGGYQFLVTSAHSLALGANNAVGQTFSATGEVVFSAGVATTPVAIGNSGTAIAVNCRLSNVFTVTMTGSVASGSFTLTNPTDGQTINIKITQDGSGSHTLGFPASILFPGGVDGVLSTAAASVDYLVMTYHADTSKWHASLTQAFA